MKAQRSAVLSIAQALVAALVACHSAPPEPSGPAVDATAPRADSGPPSSSGADGGGEGGLDAQTPPQCFTNPTTYLEIINACTDAEAIDKPVDLSSMDLADGGLQPLP